MYMHCCCCYCCNTTKIMRACCNCGMAKQNEKKKPRYDRFINASNCCCCYCYYHFYVNLRKNSRYLRLMLHAFPMIESIWKVSHIRLFRQLFTIVIVAVVVYREKCNINICGLWIKQLSLDINAFVNYIVNDFVHPASS